MKQTRIVFNSEGFRQILLSDGCHELVQKTTEEIRDKAVQNYAAVSPNGVDAEAGITARTQVGGYGGGRWIGFVSTADQYAAAAESEDTVLTRALS
jgi:hypothetical protein